MKILSNLEIKSYENYLIQNSKLSSLILMENASSSIINFLVQNRIYLSGNILILCGNGNNGGDGLAVARKLIIKKISNPIFKNLFKNLFIGIINKEKYTDENLYQQKIINSFNKEILTKNNIEIFYFDENNIESHLNRLNNINIIIDALLGFGVKGKINNDYEKIINTINNFINNYFNIKVVSIDLPSGISEDYDNNSIKSDIVLALGYFKLSLFLPYNRLKYKNLFLLDIEFPEFSLINFNNESNNEYLLNKFIVDDSFVKYFIKDKLINLRNDSSNKGDFGKTYIFSSEIKTFGASIFSSLASYYLGSGLTYYFIKKEYLNLSIKTNYPQFITLTYEDDLNDYIISNGNCFIIGPGFGKDEKLLTKILNLLLETKEKISLTKDYLNSNIPNQFKSFIILDADGINLLSNSLKLKNLLIKLSNYYSILITPHLKEFSRFTGETIENILKDPIKILKDFSYKYNISILLKNFQSFAFIKTNDKEYLFNNFKGDFLLINKGFNSGLAKGGTGDILAGVIGAFLSQGLNLFEAISISFYLFDNIHKYEKETSTSKFSYTYDFILNSIKKELFYFLNN